MQFNPVSEWGVTTLLKVVKIILVQIIQEMIWKRHKRSLHLNLLLVSPKDLPITTMVKIHPSCRSNNNFLLGDGIKSRLLDQGTLCKRRNAKNRKRYSTITRRKGSIKSAQECTSANHPKDGLEETQAEPSSASPVVKPRRSLQHQMGKN